MKEWVLFHRGWLQSLDKSMCHKWAAVLAAPRKQRSVRQSQKHTVIQAQLSMVMFRGENKNNKAKGTL